ncbi:YjcZ family sporulation protein [Sporolactobacillus sp. CPB3-1]|uniref:YjcZ family sporulation protein n=1 Tax=Sporolactobacillus mangiferae TaxID=2940498 RepID=A0ABT0M816_9BACL|nr:YjcZ family sporulation protein [Sporolactobacillus mangiferae]MCL1631010.1 YjcZ family sporulation protein [Sporolactobacillus mangiferae]
MGNFGFGGYPSNAPYGGASEGCGGYPSYPVGGYSCGNSFALIVVLFILLIIVGAAFVC